MTRKRMDRLYNELDAIGLGFEEGETRYLDKFYGKNSDLSAIGFLHNRDETPLTIEKLAEVVAVAKTKQTYCVVIPEIATSKRGALVCFLQYGLIKAIEVEAPLVSDSLRQNFSYLQEEENVLELDSALQRILQSLEDFREKSYDHASVLSTSRLLRKAINKEGHVLSRDKEIYEYMSDVFGYCQAEKLCNAINCLQLAE